MSRPPRNEAERQRRREERRRYYLSHKDESLAATRRWQRANKDKVREHVRRWRKKNKLKVKEYQRKCYYKYAEKRRAYSEAYRTSHLAERAAYLRQWQRKNKKKVAAYQKAWQKRNPGKWRAIKARVLARKISPGSVPPWFSKEHFQETVKVYDRAFALRNKTGCAQDVIHVRKLVLHQDKYLGVHVPWNLTIRAGKKLKRKPGRPKKK